MKASPTKMPFEDSWGGDGGGGGIDGGGGGGGGRSEDDDYFAAEEVEAAEIMYEAFRATKGPDGHPIDTERWSLETESRVQVRERERR